MLELCRKFKKNECVQKVGVPVMVRMVRKSVIE